MQSILGKLREFDQAKNWQRKDKATSLHPNNVDEPSGGNLPLIKVKWKSTIADIDSTTIGLVTYFTITWFGSLFPSK
jgi:hypothetical protein